VPSENLVTTPDVLVIYETPPAERQRFETPARRPPPLRASGQDWLVSRDARNMDPTGRRHQFRVVVLHDQVLRVCEHVQADPDAPCNESRGAVSTVVPIDDFPPEFSQLAVSATRSLGLPFGGVDLTIENGGVVFEVNVHPVLDVPGGVETLAIPFVRAHLPPR
jgi:ribosomal protein S6--L-glutamate ligase